MSPTEKSRVRPDPIAQTWRGVEKAFGGVKGLEEFITKGFTDVDLGVDGEGRKITVVIDRIAHYGEDVYVQGSFKAGSVNAGRFNRNIGMSDDGTHIVVDHSMLSLREKYHGLGIAQKFNDHAMAMYEELGVDRIYVDAALSVGPYAWARQGYRIDEQKTNRHDWVQDQITGMRDMVKSASDGGHVTPEQAEQMQKTLTDLRNASARGADVQPIHVASVGEGDPAWTNSEGVWLGKRQLVGQDSWDRNSIRQWNGVYYLGRESVLASAYERRMEELACRDRSCAPPPIGTGGSKPGASSGGVSFSAPLSPDRKREALRAAQNAAVEAQEARKREQVASDAHYKGQASNDTLEAMYRAQDEHKLLRWKAEKAQYDHLVARTVEAEITVKIGRRKQTFKVYKDDTEAWDDEKVTAAVNQYAKLVGEFDVDAVPIAFGEAAAVRAILEHPQVAKAWADNEINVASIRNALGNYNSANGFVLGDLARTAETWVMGITGKTAGIEPGKWNPKGFNKNVTETLDDKGRAEYVVTHEFGHMLYFNHIKDARGVDEATLLMESGMGTEWGMGHTTEGLRLPSLGTYAYSSAREFAAESFAVDYYGWDDPSGVPLEMMLGWAYGRRR